MPCSAPEKQSLTRALHWRRRRIQSLESFSSGAGQGRPLYVSICTRWLTHWLTQMLASAPCWSLMHLSEHPDCVYNITMHLDVQNTCENDLILHIRQPNRQFVLHGVAKYRPVPYRHAVSARLDVFCAHRERILAAAVRYTGYDTSRGVCILRRRNVKSPREEKIFLIQLFTSCSHINLVSTPDFVPNDKNGNAGTPRVQIVKS